MASSTKISLSIFAACAIIYALGGSFFAYQITLFLIYAIVAQGIGFVWSKTGILPLGQSLFFGLGAYGGAFILKYIDISLFQFFAFMLLIIIIGLFGFILAYIVFKGRAETGPFFALITLALTMVAEQIATSATRLTGGFNGLSGFDSFLGLDPFGNFFWVAALATTLTCFLFLRISERPLGLVMAAIDDNEPRLKLFGFSTHVFKALAFGLSTMVAGFAGILFANYQGIVTPNSVSFFLAAELIIWTAVGGRIHPVGAIIGTVVIGMLSANLRDSIEFWEIILALIFLAVVLKAPNGLWGLIDQYLPKITQKKQQAITRPHKIRHSSKSSQIEFHDLKLQIGSVKILNGVHFKTLPKGIISIIGPNGAGKTSLLNVITGNLFAKEGQILFAGHPIQNRDPSFALKDGIGRKLQVPSVFSSMSIQDNLRIATFANRFHWHDYFRCAPMYWKSEWQEQLEKISFFEFLQDAQMLTKNLPQGHKQFLEFIMTTLSQPRLLLLDEPGAGLSPEETQGMSLLIQKYSQDFNALVILIEHDMQIVEMISDQVIVMHQGKELAIGSYQAIQNNEAVKEIYIGGSKA